VIVIDWVSQCYGLLGQRYNHSFKIFLFLNCLNFKKIKNTHDTGSKLQDIA